MSKRVVYIILLILVSALIASIIVLSSVPPVAKDELVHHLAVPKLYLKHGGMYEIPFMDFSYYPMNVDFLYLIPLYFGNDIIPKFIHFSFALLTAWLIFRYLRRKSDGIYALFGALFFLSIPIIVKLSITAYIDLGIIFFSFASLLSLLQWIENGFRSRFLILSAVLCGLGLGTKYNGLVTFFLLTLFVPFLYSRYHPEARLGFFKASGQAVIFFLVSALVFSPWMIRNYHWKKNPIYPLYAHRINPAEKHDPELREDPQESSGSGLGVFVIRERIYQERGWEIALVPLRVFFAGRDGSPKHFDGELNPFLLLFSLLAFWRIKHDRERVKTEKKVMLAFSGLFFAIAFFASDLRIRYIAPIIPPLIILSVLGLANTAAFVQSMKGGRGKAVGLVVLGSSVALALSINGQYVLRQFESVQPFSYLSGKVSRDEYIARYRPEYPAIKFINDNLPPDAVVSFLFLGRRGYYCDRNYIHGEGRLKTIFEEACTPEDIQADLSRSGITHLLVCDPLFAKWVSDNFDDDKLANINVFLKKFTNIVYNTNKYFVLSLEQPLS
jgi:hypothetical protein